MKQLKLIQTSSQIEDADYLVVYYATEEDLVYFKNAVSPEITINMLDSYEDTDSVSLVAIKNGVVKGNITWSHNLADGVAVVEENTLRFLQHYEGSVTVTASALNATASKVFSIVCNEVATATTYSIKEGSLEVVGEPLPASSTTAIINFVGVTTYKYPLKADHVEESNETKTVTVTPNTSTSSNSTQNAPFEWNGQQFTAPVTLAKKELEFIPFNPEVLYYDSSNTLHTVLADEWDTVSAGSTPLAVSVVPKELAPDRKTRFMSINHVMSDGQPTDSSVQTMAWATTNADVPELPNLNKVTTLDGEIEGKEAYLPSDKFTTNQDNVTTYQDNRNGLYYGNNRKHIGSPFDKSNTFAESNTALSDMDGKGNTDTLLNLSSDNYPAAKACRLYQGADIEGVRANDWYLPSIGELAFFMVNYNKITSAFVTVGKGEFKTNNTLYSSTDFGGANVWTLGVTGGGIDAYTQKTYTCRVIPFVSPDI